ncbi:MAG: DUF4493 domain-containing protein [Parabacteroides sp.]|nr:DUF4493 domain-containing protein [Parabacteroides sp.]
MKAINIWMLSAVFFAGLTSCEMKDEIFGKDVPNETGYLTLDVNAGSSASVETKGTTDQKEDFPVIIKALEFDYTVEYDSYSQLLEETGNTGKVELPIGKYEIEAHSPGEFAEKMGEPYYGGVKAVEIIKGVEKPATVTCSIQNTKIAMNFTDEFINFYESWNITVDDKKGHSEIYTQEKTDPAPVYWKMASETDKIYVTGTAVIKTSRETVTINETLTKKDSEDYENGDSPYFGGGDGIAISLAPAKDGELNKGGIVITVEGFDQETNEEIGIGVEVGGDGEGEGGSETPSGDEPTITIPQEVYILPMDSAKNADAVIHADAGIKSVKVQIIAGNDVFINIVQGMFGEDPFELIGNATLEPVFTEMGISLPKENDLDYKFPVGNFFELLSGMGKTTSINGHEFNITVVDSNGKSATKRLSVKVEE